MKYHFAVIYWKWDGEEEFTDPSDYYKLEQKEWEMQDNQFEKAVEVLADLIAEKK